MENHMGREMKAGITLGVLRDDYECYGPFFLV